MNNLEVSLKVLECAVEVEVYLIKETMTSYIQDPTSFICSDLYLLVNQENDNLFHISGIVTGTDSDEEFSLSIQPGWQDFEIVKVGRETRVEYRNTIKVAEQTIISKLEKVVTLSNYRTRTIFTKSIGGERLVSGFLFIEEENTRLFVGQHILPYSILVTSNDELIQEEIGMELP